MTPAVTVHELSKRFVVRKERRTSLKERLVRGREPHRSEFWALRDVTFEVPRGGCFGVVGHNGSGKSTMLKILAGIYRPTSGSVHVNGSVSALLELGAGFHPELTGRENIRLNASLLGLSPKQIAGSIDEIADFAGVGEFIDSPVKVYSSGMTVRLGFAVAVKMDPDILIVDEVLAVGDEEFQRRCFDYLHDLRQGGTTIILVTHSMGAVEALCDGAVWLKGGRVVGSGSPAEVVSSYIREVNRQEAARTGTAQSLTPEDDGRGGSGEIRVTEVRILDPATGAELPFATSDRACRFRIQYEASTTVTDFEVALGFYTGQGACVAFPSTHKRGPAQRTEPGRGFIDLEVAEALALRAGHYRMSTIVAREGHFYDLLHQRFALTVRSEEPPVPGFVRFDGTWGRATGLEHSLSRPSGSLAGFSLAEPRGGS